MNTLDPKAPYGHCTGCTDPRTEGTHQEGTIEHPMMDRRERLLSVHEMMMGNMQAMDVADHYESLITKGVLRVVKKVEVDPMAKVTKCPDCVSILCIPEDNFCPGCGGEIQKPQ